jgi:TonB family protein
MLTRVLIVLLFTMAMGPADSQELPKNGVVIGPVVKKQVFPRGPVDEKVLLECVVKTDGTVDDVKIITSEHPDLDRAVIDAMRQWLFKPATKDGEPVAMRIAVELKFRQ